MPEYTITLTINSQMPVTLADIAQHRATCPALVGTDSSLDEPFRVLANQAAATTKRMGLCGVCPIVDCRLNPKPLIAVAMKQAD